MRKEVNKTLELQVHEKEAIRQKELETDQKFINQILKSEEKDLQKLKEKEN